MWDVRSDQFDSLDEIYLGRLEFEDLSFDEPELEAVLFGGDDENGTMISSIFDFET